MDRLPEKSKHPKLEINDGDLLNKESANSLIPELFHSALSAGIVNPAKSIAQSIDQSLGFQTELKLEEGFKSLGLESRASAEFNSGRWYQQQLGFAVGAALPFLALRGLLKSGLPASSESAIHRSASKSILKTSSDEAFISGSTGLLYGSLLTPNSTPSKSASDFAYQRMKQGVENALLFGALGFTVPIISSALTAGARSLAQAEVIPANKALATAMESPVTTGLASAVTAGTISAESSALKDGRLLPNATELNEHVTSMTFVIGVLGAVHKVSTRSQDAPLTQRANSKGSPFPIETLPNTSLSTPNIARDAKPNGEGSAIKIQSESTAKEYKLRSNEEQNIRILLEGQTDYKLLGKMERGTRGAWLVESPSGAQKIFKIVDKERDVTEQINVSARASAALDSIQHPTSRFERVQFTKPFGSWYVQEKLDGIPAPAPTDRLIGQMVRMNSQQQGTAVGGKDWSHQVMSALYRDKYGWQNKIASSGPEGASLVSDLRKLFEANSQIKLRTNDIVHGDFQHYNALVNKNDRLTGYIDWEGAGKGDRSIDLSRLLYDAYVAEKEINFRTSPQTLKMLNDKIKEASGAAARDNLMAYWVLQVADFGVNVGRSDVYLGVGRRILNDIQADRVPIQRSRLNIQPRRDKALSLATVVSH